MQGYAGMDTRWRWRCQLEGKEEGQGEGGWIWQEKTWKGLELRKETKSIGSNGKYFRAVATPNMEKPKEEEEEDKLAAYVEVSLSPYQRLTSAQRFTNNPYIIVILKESI